MLWLMRILKVFLLTLQQEYCRIECAIAGGTNLTTSDCQTRRGSTSGGSGNSTEQTPEGGGYMRIEMRPQKQLPVLQVSG